jgi:hypothetical protein
MKPPRFRILTPMIAVAVASVVVLAWWYSRNPLSVTVTNETVGALDDVVVNYTGGAGTWRQLPPGSKVTWSIHPRGESSIVLSYRDAKGLRIEKDGNIYVEAHGYRGCLTFRVVPSGVTVVNNIEPSLF